MRADAAAQRRAPPRLARSAPPTHQWKTLGEQQKRHFHMTKSLPCSAQTESAACGWQPPQTSSSRRNAPAATPQRASPPK